MIELDYVLAILRELKEEAMDKVDRPGEHRDAFAYGQINGMLYVAKTFEQRLHAKIEEDQENERKKD